MRFDHCHDKIEIEKKPRTLNLLGLHKSTACNKLVTLIAKKLLNQIVTAEQILKFLR